jgi:hypothetical protein
MHLATTNSANISPLLADPFPKTKSIMANCPAAVASPLPALPVHQMSNTQVGSKFTMKTK